MFTYQKKYLKIDNYVNKNKKNYIKNIYYYYFFFFFIDLFSSFSKINITLLLPISIYFYLLLSL